MIKKNCLFLGYNNKQTKLIKFLKQNNYEINNSKKRITFEQIKKYDLIISYGYKKIINEDLVNKLKNPIINLHIGYLPFNRGFHPNLWSFLEILPLVLRFMK